MTSRKRIVASGIASGALSAMLLMPGLSAAQTGGAGYGGAGGAAPAGQTTGTGGTGVQAPGTGAPTAPGGAGFSGSGIEAPSGTGVVGSQPAPGPGAGSGIPGTDVGTGLSQTGPGMGTTGQAPTGPTGVQSPLGTDPNQQQNTGASGTTTGPAGSAGTNVEINQPGITPPNVGQPGITQPNVGQPGVTPPNIVQPGMSAPDPGVRGPDMTQPGVRGPDMSQPGVTAPNVGQPGVTGPSVGQPGLPSQANVDLSGSQLGSLTLQSGTTLNGVPLVPGQELQIVGIPSNVTLPIGTEMMTLPSGTMVMIPGHPELGVITLDARTAAGISGQFSAMSQQGLPGAPGLGERGITAPGIALPGVENEVAVPGLGDRLDLGATRTMSSLTLDQAIVLNGVQISPGQQIDIISLPSNFTLPQTGMVTLPSGAVVSLPGMPQLGIVTLDSSFGSIVAGQLMGPIDVLGSISLNAPIMLGGVLFPAGQPLDIMSLPIGFNLPSSGPVVLPVGTMVFIPGRPDLGNIVIESPLPTEVGTPGFGLITPMGAESVSGVQLPGAPTTESVAGVQVPGAPTTESVFVPGGIPLQVRQIPSTGGPSAPIAALGLTLLAGAGLALRRFGKR